MKNPTLSLERALLSTSQLKLPPFKYEVSGPSLCPGRLYTLNNRSDEHRLQFFAATALAAVTGRPELIGWENAPGRVPIVVPRHVFRALQDPFVALARHWEIELPDLNGRLRFLASDDAPRVADIIASLGDRPFSVLLPPTRQESRAEQHTADHQSNRYAATDHRCRGRVDLFRRGRQCLSARALGNVPYREDAE